LADTFWDRIEPHTRAVDLQEGLQVQVADPLWLLARQWQVGEFRGEDAASPIHVRLSVEHTPLTSFRNDARADAAPEPFAQGRPLESRVEAEALAPASPGFSASVGLGLLRRLDDAGLAHLRAPLRGAYGLQLSPGDTAGLPARSLRRLRLLARASLDGLRLLRADAAQVAALLPAPDRAAFATVFERWRLAHGRLIDEPGPSGETWVDDRLEHRFSLSAAGPGGEVVVSAAGYPGGHLDWYAFDASGPALQRPPRPAGTVARTLDRLPVPLAYAGMPRSRYWEFEEGTVSFGDITAGPADIGRLIVAEFATIYSDNWFLLPVRFPTGSLARVVSAVVHNTFGERHEVRSAAQWDEEAATAEEPRVWAFCELAGDGSAAAGHTPWLLLLPTVAGGQDGRPLESVSFVRDEVANLAWAIEERVEAATGEPLRRRLTTALANGADDDAAPSADSYAPWPYRLQSAVPPYWIPLLPERVSEASAQVMLRRGRMQSWEELPDPRLAGPQGRVLAPDRPLRLHEEEIPATGVEVTRHWQLARGPDGRLHAWLGRRRRPGRGERGSGLRNDAISRAAP
jgi:hypothetical protein